EHHGRQRAGGVQFLATALDASVIGEFSKHCLECGAVGVLEPEGARDLARADLAGLSGDEGDQIVLRGKTALIAVVSGQEIVQVALRHIWGAPGRIARSIPTWQPSFSSRPASPAPSAFSRSAPAWSRAWRGAAWCGARAAHLRSSPRSWRRGPREARPPARV